ncbi:MAG: hypothetical protein ACJASR_002374 [Psychroserpens sp.]
MKKFNINRYWIKIISLLLLLPACSDNTGSIDTFSRQANNGINRIVVEDILESIPFVDLADSIQYVVLESIDNGSTFLGNIEKVTFFDGRFYVLDTKTAKGLFCFNSDGSHLFSLKMKGDGPGEFVRITDFDINEKKRQIQIYDEGNGRMSLFSLDGDYLGEGPRLSVIGIFPDSFVLLGDTAILYNNNNCSDYGCNSVHLVNLKNELISQGIDNKNLSGFNVDFGTPIARNRDEVAFTQILNDSIYLLGGDLSIKTPYVIDFGKYKMNLQERNELINNPMQISSFIAQSNKTPGPAYINLNDDFILLTFLQNRVFVTLVIERKTHEYKVFRNYWFNNYEYIPTFIVVGNYENKFIYFNGNEYMLNFKESNDSIDSHPYAEVLKSINDRTNGVIAIVTFQKFKQAKN